MSASADELIRGSLAGVVVALAIEAETAQALAGRGWRVRVGGVGREPARHEAEVLLASGVRRLLVWGTAAGLSPTLRAGTLMVPETVVNDANNERFAVSREWRARLAEALAPLGFPFVGGGLLASVAAPLTTPAEKAAVAARTGALMADMESAAVAAVAAREGIEFAVVRALVDPHDLALPPVIRAAANRPHPQRSVCGGLFRRPQDLPAVLRLGRSFRCARVSLTAAAEALAAAHGL